jgi:opacity protein-like surface antigen
VRLELESSYSFHSVSSVQSLNGASTSATGHSDIQAEIANAIYDFPVAPGWNFYAGAGIGDGHVNSTAAPSGTGYQVADLDHGAMIWQLIGGASFEVTPDVDLFVDYRFRDAHARDTVLVDPVGSVLSGITTDNVVVVGMRFYPGFWE